MTDGDGQDAERAPEGCPAAGDGGVRIRSMRRRDRALPDREAVADLLESLPVGVLAARGGERPVLNANLFAFLPEGPVLYLHTARDGRTRRAVERDPRVAFVAFELGRLLPADRALAFSAEYRSVVAFGRASIVEDSEEARRALRALLRRYAPHLRPGRDYRDVTDAEIDRTTVIRVDVEGWSGKANVADEAAEAYAWPPAGEGGTA